MMNRRITIPPLLQAIGKTLGVIIFSAVCLLMLFHSTIIWALRALPCIVLIASLVGWNRNRVRAASLLFVAAFIIFFPLLFDPAVWRLPENALDALFGIWLTVFIITLGIAIRVVSADDRQRAANRAPHAE